MGLKRSSWVIQGSVAAEGSNRTNVGLKQQIIREVTCDVNNAQIGPMWD